MFSNRIQQTISRAMLVMVFLGLLATTTVLADDFMYVTAQHLNVRSEGTFRSGIIATIDSGYKVVILEKLSNGWDKVLLENGQVGYVNARYLGTSEPYFEKVEGSEYEVSVPNAFVRADGLRKKIAVLHRGDRLEVLDRKIFLQKWIRVRIVTAEKEGYIGRVGYISKNIAHVVEGTRYEGEVPALGSAPTEDTLTADWIGNGNNGMTFNSAPEEPITESGADMTEFLQALGNINTGTIVNVSTGTTDTGGFEDLLGGLLDDTDSIQTNTGTTDISGTTNTGTTEDPGLNDLFNSLLN